MKIIAGDIGKTNDFAVTALIRGSPTAPRAYHVAGLDRWRGEKYQHTVQRLVLLAARHPDAVVAVDAGGVGRPVLDLVRDALPGRKVFGIVSTGGRNANAGQEAGDVNVPKADLIGVLQVLLQAKRLTYSPALALVRELQGEFQRYEGKVTKALNVTYEGVGAHDDIVSACAIGCWVGENLPAPLTDARVAGLVLNGPSWKGQAAGEGVRSRMEQLADDHPALFGSD